MMTSFRGFSTRFRKARSIASPPVPREARPGGAAAEPAQVEAAPARMRAQASRAPLGPRGRAAPDELAGAGELLGCHGGEVLAAQDLLEAPAGRVRLLAGALVLPGDPPLRRRLLDELDRLLSRRLRAARRRDRRPQEPGAEGPVEGLDLLHAGYERRAQRPVDVVPARHGDPGEG